MEGRDDVRAPTPARVAAPLAVVVVVAPAAALPAGWRADERCAAGAGPGGTAVDRAVAGVPPIAVSGRLDRRRRRAASRIGARRAAQRRNLDHPGYGYLQQHAGGGLLTRQPARRGAPHGDGIRPRPNLRPHRARGIRGTGADPGADHHRLRSTRGSHPPAARGYPRRRDGNRHRHRHQREPPAPHSRQEQGRRVAHRWREQQGDGGSAHGGAGRGDIRHQDLHDRGRDRGRGPSPDRAGTAGPAIRDDAGEDRRAAAERGRAHDGRSLLPRDGRRLAVEHLCGDQSAGEDAAAASRLPSLRRGVSRAAGDWVAGVGARAGPGGHIRGARAMITFDAPVVITLAPVVAGAVWAASAWARRARVRRAAAWSESTARIARAAGKLGAPALGLAAGLAAVALSGPRWGEQRIVTETRGLNLVLAIDISRSMLAEDAKPSRLGRALREARRLVQDLDGDRLGLSVFAGTSYILSPLSVDGSALTLYLDALDPDVASEGGTSLAPGLAQGIDLLHASPEIADRVLVVFTDGEAHDSLEPALQEARRLAGLGIHLILVAEGGREPTRIPVRDDRGTLVSWQQDGSGNPVLTSRREDVLGAVADAAQGTIVAAELPDQAGAVRDLVASYKRATATESRTQGGRPRAWIPLLLAALVLGAQTFTRRTAALIGLLFCVAAPTTAHAQRPRSPAEKAWDKGDVRAAATAYLAELKVHEDDDTAWYNTGTAALAAGDPALARSTLARASASLDPELRFRALYNLGLLALLEAKSDTTNRETHLADAERAYREALLLQPHHIRAKWNLELVNRQRWGGGGANKPNPPPPPPQSGGGGGQQQQQPPPPPSGGGMSESQADQVLRSIGQEELRTRRDRTGRTRRAAPAGVKDW